MLRALIALLVLGVSLKVMAFEEVIIQAEIASGHSNITKVDPDECTFRLTPINDGQGFRVTVTSEAAANISFSFELASTKPLDPNSPSLQLDLDNVQAVYPNTTAKYIQGHGAGILVVKRTQWQGDVKIYDYFDIEASRGLDDPFYIVFERTVTGPSKTDPGTIDEVETESLRCMF